MIKICAMLWTRLKASSLETSRAARRMAASSGRMAASSLDMVARLSNTPRVTSSGVSKRSRESSNYALMISLPYSPRAKDPCFTTGQTPMCGAWVPNPGGQALPFSTRLATVNGWQGIAEALVAWRGVRSRCYNLWLTRTVRQRAGTAPHNTFQKKEPTARQRNLRRDKGGIATAARNLKSGDLAPARQRRHSTE